MAEDLIIPENADKEAIYKSLYRQLEALISGESDSVANCGNLMAGVMTARPMLWVGLYLVKSDGEKEELVLGPFQGPVACTRISFGKGVCGHAWKEGKTIIVPDVEKFPGHITCSSLSRSEIVVPVFKNEKVIAVLDVDSTDLNAFDSVDQVYLEKIAELVARCL